MEDIVYKLRQETSGSAISINEPMSAHCSFRIGGNADIFINAKIDDIPPILSILKENHIDITILGNGTNVLFGDAGIRGAVIYIGEKSDGVDIKDNIIYANAGELLNKAAKLACENSLGGLEFAAGIPGTVGGAVLMNAGAFGGEIADWIDRVSFMDIDTGEKRSLSGRECEFSYRDSIFMRERYIVLEIAMKLVPRDRNRILEVMENCVNSRKAKQPLDYPSAGSTFKRPKGYFAGKLIEESGLQGATVGGAMVSEKHAGFIINYNNATASDVLNLMEKVQTAVYKKFGVELQREVKLIGEFSR